MRVKPFTLTLLLTTLVVAACSSADDIEAEETDTSTTTDTTTDTTSTAENWDALTTTVFDDSSAALSYETNRAMVCSYNTIFCTTTNSNMQTYEGKGVLISWRWLQSDGNSATYNLYRNGTLLNTTPLSVTNYKDYDISEGTRYTYTLTHATTGATLATTSYTPEAGMFYQSITMNNNNLRYSYEINDCAVGDLDGDGEYEIVVKRFVEGQATDNPGSGQLTGSAILEAYRLSGTLMWRIDMGVNILQGSHYSSFVVYDLTGDGCANVALRTAEGTTFGDGTTIGDTNADGITDYRETDGRIISGPEFVSIVDGTTGKEDARANWIPRGDESTWTSYWGDSYGTRMNRYHIGVAHLGGINGRASLIITRGIYQGMQVWAYHYQDGNIYTRWKFNTSDSGYSTYAGQGFHSLSVGDVDSDGNDEIVYGACTIDHDGTGLYTTKLGHGDALHLGKFIPSRAGLQVVACHEEVSVHGGKGCEIHDAQTGEILFYIYGSDDVGRCMVADINPDNEGCEYWSSADGGATMYSCTTGKDLGVAPPKNYGSTYGSYNMGIWWSGSLNRQCYDGGSSSYNNLIVSYTEGRLFQGEYHDAYNINGTKNNACFIGDIWGDWREEFITRTSDNSELRIFTTDFATDYRIHPLMDDHTYRLSAVHQNVGYNQPTHTGFYLGSDVTDYSD